MERTGNAGDYGGVISIPASAGGAYTVELALEYEVRGIKEHDTTQYTDVAAGDSASFEFFMPSDLARGGQCDVQLVSVTPER